MGESKRTDVQTDVKSVREIHRGNSGELHLLVMIGEEVRSHSLDLSKSYVIGRMQQCDIPIINSTVSRKHAVLHVGGKLFIEDCGSLNGVWLGGKQLLEREKREFLPGELIELGDAVLVVQQKPIRQLMHQFWKHQYFENRLEVVCENARRSKTAFSLMLVQIDESVPKDVVESAISSSLRDTDIAAKSSSNRYEILMPDTSVAMAEASLRRLTEAFGRFQSEVRIGVACCPRDGNQPHVLLDVANKNILANKPSDYQVDSPLVLQDEHMRHLYRLIERIACSNISVIIQGETGVGKEVIARRIHKCSKRPEHLFVSVNCAALPESLLESELFGHKQGAFTGATKDKAGLLEVAKNGTFLLDEVSEMSLPIQAKLLRMLEERKAVRIGDVKPYPIRARFLATSNRDLEEEVHKGSFRQDLYFRLNGISISIPPLRMRVEEIEPLSMAFIEQMCQQLGRSSCVGVSDVAIQWLLDYRWPGNVRELRNTIERAVLLNAGGPISVDDLTAGERRYAPAKSVPDTDMDDFGPLTGVPTRLRQPVQDSDTDGNNLKDELKKIEYRRILEALKVSGGNQTKAAKLLGISRRTLINRLDEYRIDRPRKSWKKRTQKIERK